jgi:hypothetical protein
VNASSGLHGTATATATTGRGASKLVHVVRTATSSLGLKEEKLTDPPPTLKESAADNCKEYFLNFENS